MSIVVFSALAVSLNLESISRSLEGHII